MPTFCNRWPTGPQSLLWTKPLLLLYFIILITLFLTSAQECGTGRFNRHRDPRDPLYLNQDISDILEGSGDELSGSGGNGYDGAARLVGGTASVPGEWPWQATLQLRHPRWGFVGHWCAGVLIHPRWVITAGHCITNRLFNLPRANYWTVVLGKYNLRMKEPNEIVRRVSRIVLHEKFQEYHNDLALIKLAQPVSGIGPLEFVNPICLPNTNLTRNETFVGLRCVATGWGRAKVGGRNSDYLQKVELPIVANDVCKGAYQNEPMIPIRNYHVCAGYAAGGKGTCVGDSGGPLQCPIGDGRWFLVGLTSFGSGCAKPSFPDVFTRVTYYLDWIQKHMKGK